MLYGNGLDREVSSHLGHLLGMSFSEGSIDSKTSLVRMQPAITVTVRAFIHKMEVEGKIIGREEIALWDAAEKTYAFLSQSPGPFLGRSKSPVRRELPPRIIPVVKRQTIEAHKRQVMPGKEGSALEELLTARKWSYELGDLERRLEDMDDPVSAFIKTEVRRFGSRKQLPRKTLLTVLRLLELEQHKSTHS